MLLTRRSALAVLAALAAAALPALPAAEKTSAPPSFFFKDGDRVVMMGDSITEQHLYSNYVEMWTVSRFPAWKLTFRNVGIGGDTSTGGNRRFQRDVVRYKATAMTVDFGMNDGGYRPFDPGRFDAYMKGLQGIADQAKAAGVRVAWVTPQPVEHAPQSLKQEFYNKTLERFSAGVKEIADKNGGLFVDQFHPYEAVIEKARQAGPGRITAGDAVHPGKPGQALMAASILKGLHFPRLVARVDMEVVSTGLPAVKTKNCRVSQAAVGGKAGGAPNELSFQQEDNALPFFPEGAESILKWSPILTDLNHYELRVKGLKPGRYEIRLGGKKVAAHSAEELARGVNLAEAVLKEGPVADQVRKVWKAVADKNRYFHDQVFRGVVLNGKLSKDEREKLFEQRMLRMPELDAAVRQALVMRPHRVEIVPAREK